MSKPNRRDLEPEQALRDEVEDHFRRHRQRLIDWGRNYLTVKLGALLASVIAGSAVAVYALPIFAAVLLSVGALLAVGVAIFARRLLLQERSRRRWAEVAVLRQRQRALVAEDAIDEATLGLMGKVRPTEMRRARELRHAVLALRSRLTEAHAPSVAPGAASRRRELSRPLDTKPIVLRRERRAAELAALEAEIQALADPTNAARLVKARETSEAERAARKAAMAADAEARARTRRGLAPAAAESEAQHEVVITPVGVREVKRGEARATPEQIAAARPGRDVNPHHA